MSDRITNPWAQQLGLTATPLFGRERPDANHQHLALLDGVRASFLLSSDSSEDISAAPDWAWSSDVRHHILLKQRQIVVTRTSGSKTIFERASVESRLAEFLRYLELDSDSQKIVGVIDHLIRLFRQHRTTLRQAKMSSVSDLQSFLYLLAISEEQDSLSAHHHGEGLIEKYSLGDFDPTQLSDSYVFRFVEAVRLSSTSMRRLLTPLTVRHAGGALFQEAHAEILSDPIQMTLFGLANAAQQRLDLSRLGVYYTPPGLARTLTEIAIEPHLNRDVIKINDPACGSGIFLCEAIRVLQRRKYAGKVVLFGHDISHSAVQMARFSIACALLDWPGHQVNWNVESADFFDALITRHRFNVVLMNPPFLSWEALTSEQREFVRDVLEDKYAGRPDLSTAFIQESLTHLSPGGTLATLLPRGVLDSKSGRKWREALLSKNDVRLIGTFGEHGLFRHAMVSIGAAIFERKRPDAATVMVWADERPNSAEGALRALRRQLATNNLIDERSANWSIYSMKSRDLATRKTWLPTPNALGGTLDLIEKKRLPRVEQLFTVRQGIKTGLNEAFIISDDELKVLPSKEMRFFRRVVNGEDIAGGHIRSSMNIFYVPNLFTSKKQLLDEVPVFGRKLLAYENSLKRRPRTNPQRWWEPVWPRKDLAARTPRILTKMFGGLNMAAPDAKGEFLPLQAFAWMPNHLALNVGEGLEEAALWWYCRILNSRIFFLLRREFAAAITSGGQLDVSPKYVGDVPIPTPGRDDLISLASIGEPDLAASWQNDEIVAAAYGTHIELWPAYAADYTALFERTRSVPTGNLQQKIRVQVWRHIPA
jgi:adenine-specific DNA-methyltransferase